MAVPGIEKIDFWSLIDCIQETPELMAELAVCALEIKEKVREKLAILPDVGTHSKGQLDATFATSSRFTNPRYSEDAAGIGRLLISCPMVEEYTMKEQLFDSLGLMRRCPPLFAQSVGVVLASVRVVQNPESPLSPEDRRDFARDFGQHICHAVASDKADPRRPLLLRAQEMMASTLMQLALDGVFDIGTSCETALLAQSIAPHKSTIVPLAEIFMTDRHMQEPLASAGTHSHYGSFGGGKVLDLPPMGPKLRGLLKRPQPAHDIVIGHTGTDG